MPAPLKVSRDDWIRGALGLISEAGFEALSVEGVARKVGATKGSFYHHFADRAALVAAVLEAWREAALTSVISEMEDQPTSERLATLLNVSMVSASDFHENLEWAILAAADDPVVGAVVNDVHRQRTNYLAGLFHARGLPQDVADARSRICYAAYLGNLQLLHAGLAPARGARPAFHAELLAMIDAPTR